MKAIRPGDWAVNCIRGGRGVEVWPPEQLLSIESYPRGNGKRRWLMQLEAPYGAQPIWLTEFRRNTRDMLVLGKRGGVRTRPIYDSAAADAILRLWTESGRRSKYRAR